MLTKIKILPMGASLVNEADYEKFLREKKI